MSAARRRRRRSAAKRSRGRRVLPALLVAAIVLLAVGSLIEIHAQSGEYRASTNAGYGAMASKLVVASNQTGSQLAALIDGAPQLTNQTVPYNIPYRTARSVLQQGLDDAVSSASDEAGRAARLEPPAPAANAGARLAAVLSDRAAASAALRSNIDQMLGMSPLTVAGGPQPSRSSAPSPLIPPDQAVTGATAVGVLYQHADDEYAALLTDLHANRVPILLPRSVWVPPPMADAPLGPARLGTTVSALATSGALAPWHQLIITAIGLTPTPVASGGPQTTIPGCIAPQSNTTGASPTVMPPTTVVDSTVTVTNCGNVDEPQVTVTQSLARADPAGAAPPPPGASGGSSQARVSLRSGSSAALSMKALAVAPGHSYTLTFTIAISVSQAANDPAGATQQLVLHISG
jgi:hypothetical protein